MISHPFCGWSGHAHPCIIVYKRSVQCSCLACTAPSVRGFSTLEMHSSSSQSSSSSSLPSSSLSPLITYTMSEWHNQSQDPIGHTSNRVISWLISVPVCSTELVGDDLGQRCDSLALQLLQKVVLWTPVGTWIESKTQTEQRYLTLISPVNTHRKMD